MKFSLKDQFEGFIQTPQIFSHNSFFKYPLFKTEGFIAEASYPELKEPASRVLGKRMEDFFNFYISNFSSQEVLSHNQQIILDKKTLGELDFLLKDPASEEITHVELIYKFYLYDPDSGCSEKDHLIGPNKRDSLNRKLNRLQKRQFPLLFNEATQDLLDTLQISSEKVVQKMCFKASVFLPKLQREIRFSEINPETVAGYWIKFKDFTDRDYGKYQFYSPKKKYWPVAAHLNQEWYSYKEIMEQIEEFMKQQLSVLLWIKTPSGDIEKCFVVWW